MELLGCSHIDRYLSGDKEAKQLYIHEVILAYILEIMVGSYNWKIEATRLAFLMVSVSKGKGKGKESDSSRRSTIIICRWCSCTEKGEAKREGNIHVQGKDICIRCFTYVLLIV